MSLIKFLILAAILVCASAARAEDTDLFAGSTTVGTGSRPNIIILIDNSSNWSAANQQWPGGVKQGEAELAALRFWVGTLSDNVNVGLMMFTEGSGSNYNGAYVRFAARQNTSRASLLGFAPEIRAPRRRGFGADEPERGGRVIA